MCKVICSAYQSNTILRGRLISLSTVVIELVEMTIYTISGGFDKRLEAFSTSFNHHNLSLVFSPDQVKTPARRFKLCSQE